MTVQSLSHSLQTARVLVCAGTGGVGKTTIAAALAIEAARAGRRTLVLTIDPARRLADALGESGLGSTPNVVHLSHTHDIAAGGSLEAVMLDPKPTFDRLVVRLTDDPVARERILENRIYRHLSEALAGSAEYAAMEQVHEFVDSGRYDLVVVDTPPSSHALDFLSAPRRLRDFLESRFVHALVRPAVSAGRFGIRLLGKPLQRMFGLLERIAGVGFLDDLSEFLTAIDGLSEGFRERASHVEDVLLGEETGFVLVCGPDSGLDANTFEFLEELESQSARLAAVVVNRVRDWPPGVSAAEWREEAARGDLAGDSERLRQALRDSGDGEAIVHAQAVVDIVTEVAAARDAADFTLRKLEARVAGQKIDCYTVPEFTDDLDRLDGLRRIGAALHPPMHPPPQPVLGGRSA